ncbi:MucR family transcriptional regulator [Methylobacterium mesophilicum SR1.6/6]|uniref:MucR family transcriptional regulator n=1 Tax=Methylobacterium mesophilicum SR1.6/6 TaxID=908290 RepID=A0A6B9FK28_9HYPH|nr:MucR family transcriptional regulator [Methylobacterium mesophilicum]QGY02362.1 MucR family transcriptional regulator [Methylobacterium mesophilicum SR1.6/6]
MSEEIYDLTPGIDTAVDYTVNIVANYLRVNHVPAADVPGLIRAVHAAISGLTRAAEPRAAGADALDKPTTAQIRKSVSPDAIVSFIDGRPYKSMKRHLTANGLDPKAYRERYGLPSDYPMVAASYAEKRSALAKAIGLGQHGGQAQRKPLHAVA